MNTDIYFNDETYLPISYQGQLITQPFFKGDGEHSVKELEEICKQFKQYVHQQKIIKQNCQKIIVDLKFNDKKT